MDTIFDLLNPDEAAANSRGQILPAQVERLKRLTGVSTGCWPLVLTVILIVASCFCVTMTLALLDASFEVTVLVWGGLFLLSLLAVAAVGLKVILRNAAFSRDCSTNAIQQAVGQLVFAQKSLKIGINGRLLRLPDQESACGLLPGVNYRIYYLKDSGLALSAEKIAPPDPEKVRLALNLILAQANGFSLPDLEANRNGQILPIQRIKLLPGALGGFALSLVAFIITLVIIFSSGFSLAVCFPALIFAIFFYAGSVMFSHAFTDAIEKVPAQLTGTGGREKQRGQGRDSSMYYYYTIDESALRVNKRGYSVLVPGLQYRAFYFPQTHKLLSIEVISLPPSALA
jgi:hypothetical protein